MYLYHLKCKAPIRLVVRQIITAPEDTHWPKDVSTEVPYCDDCKRVVDFTGVGRQPQR